MLTSSNRKDEHIKYANSQYEHKSNSFLDCHIVYNSIAKVNFNSVDLSTEMFNRVFPLPFFINAMTGGGSSSFAINQKLAILARETGMAMASGSLSAALKDPKLMPDFQIIRKMNPDGFVLANIGAEQSLDMALKAIDILDADAIQIHLNLAQEMIMPEGDRDFKSYKDSLATLIAGLEIPVIVKETGFGMSRETIQELIDMGANYIDISGAGGTDFIGIENARRPNNEFSYLTGFGQSTLISLLEAQEFINADKVDIIASGGISNPLDLLKCLSLGAKAVGASAFFLHQVLSYEIEEAINNVWNFLNELKTLFTIYNAQNIQDLNSLDLVFSGFTREWAQSRGIKLDCLANRSKMGHSPNKPKKYQ